MYFMMTDPNS